MTKFRFSETYSAALGIGHLGKHEKRMRNQTTAENLPERYLGFILFYIQYMSLYRDFLSF